jgi:hypothetical protein
MCSTWPGRSVRTASIFSNRIKDKTARRTPQTHVRKRSDVLRRPARICTGVGDLGGIGKSDRRSRLSGWSTTRQEPPMYSQAIWRGYGQEAKNFLRGIHLLGELTILPNGQYNKKVILA